MKKLLYLLLLLPLGFLSSCDDDDDFPAVDVTVNLDNAAMVNNQIYVVQSEGFKIEGITARSLTDQQAALANVVYGIDGIFAGAPVLEPPYNGDIQPNELSAGIHYLQFRFTILQVDKSLAYGYMRTTINVVEKVEDLPEGAELGKVSITDTINPKDK